MARLRLGQWDNLLVVLIVAAAVLFRLTAYGDLRLSVGNAETQSYITSSLAPVLSWDAFAGKRLFTTNLVFKLANNHAQCPLTAVSDPAEGLEVSPTLQPCFDGIVLLQSLLSIAGWCYLAWTTSRWLRHWPAKVGVTLVLLAFAFTPQIAEWDNLLSPESLSVTLFVISFALLEENAFRVSNASGNPRSSPEILLLVGWPLVFTLWVFVRDVHLYSVLTSAALVSILLLDKKIGRRESLVPVIAVLVGVFVLGYYSARDSRRATRYPLVHAFETYVLPFPRRVEFFTKLGMPDSTSPAYSAWLDDNAARTYGAFLVLHPRFVAATLWDNIDYFAADFTQPYFDGQATWNRTTLLKIGELLHVKSTAVYLIDILLLTGLCLRAVRDSGASIRVWTWLVAWFFLGSALALLASFFGDTEGFLRHLFPSVESFRLLMWILVFIYLDGFPSGVPTSKGPAERLSLDVETA